MVRESERHHIIRGNVGQAGERAAGRLWPRPHQRMAAITLSRRAQPSPSLQSMTCLSTHRTVLVYMSRVDGVSRGCERLLRQEKPYKGLSGMCMHGDP